MTELAITYRDVASLVEYEHNSRTHDADQVDKIANSIQEFGFTNPLLIDPDGMIVAGHGRLMAARKLGIGSVPVIELGHLTPEQRRAYVIADNKLALESGWDMEALASELAALGEVDFDLSLLGFDADELDEIRIDDEPEDKVGLTDDDAVPEIPERYKSRMGDVWMLGEHRVMCGDSTDQVHVAALMNDAQAALLHADPPYGMGKESDGVANDNLYRDKLDAFQMSWWSAFRLSLADNASAYIWGNAPDLWRLWYSGGLADSERMTMRNEISWDKGGGGFGVGSEAQRCYFPAERCLFFMLGEQGFNTSADNYWEGWEPIRSWLDNERKQSGLTTDQCNQICGKQNMTQSAFTRGGFRLILREDYEKLRAATNGKYFKREYDELKREYDELKREYDELKREYYATRAYFDNTHDNMTDVWSFPRVTGEERHGHATPKPVDMMARVMKSSLPQGGLCVEPFGGSGSTLIGAEKTGRKCYSMELQPKYVDTIVARWQAFTGQQAVRESDGLTFGQAAYV